MHIPETSLQWLNTSDLGQKKCKAAKGTTLPQGKKGCRALQRHAGGTKKEQNLQHRVHLLFLFLLFLLSGAVTSVTSPGSSPGPTEPRAGAEGSPTMCSTSRAVYLLIASSTIAHNNQLRHCQRNTHSWHHTAGSWAGGLESSSPLLHTGAGPGDKHRVREELQQC